MPAVESFLNHIVRSGLLSRGELDEALGGVPIDHWPDPDSVAEHLIEAGRLSRFQARKLLQGKYSGLVLGSYQVLSPIGKGGMSTVYLARDGRSQGLVALKVLPPKKAQKEQRHLARFRREMTLCRRVGHPNLARTYEVGVSQGVYYIALEYIPGRSLFRLVNDHGPLSVPRAARLFAEAASALEHAHRRGLIHRDLKPSNIMVTPKDHAKVLDLGLALIEGEVPTDHTVVGGRGYVVGTMDYVAPEQAQDATKVDGRADIYGLGCTLYFALTGRPPFPGGSVMEKILRHLNEMPTPLAKVNSQVPTGFEAVVHRMMAKRPEDRFSTAAALQQELLLWASGEASHAAPPGNSDSDSSVVEIDMDSSDSIVIEIVEEDAASAEARDSRAAAPADTEPREVHPIEDIHSPTYLIMVILASVIAWVAGAAVLLVFWMR
jgi:serine/threonine protein kinase